MSISPAEIERLSADLRQTSRLVGARGVPAPDAYAFGPGRTASCLSAVLADWEHQRRSLVTSLTALADRVAAAGHTYAATEEALAAGRGG